MRSWEAIMKNKKNQRTGLNAAHTGPENSNTSSHQARVMTESRSNPAMGASQSQANNKDQLQNLLPELNALAQRVGGMKRLAELTNALAQAKE
jgi:hypothetical protein